IRSKFLAVSLAGICVLDIFASVGCVVYPAQPAVVVRPAPVVVRPRAVVVRPGPIVVRPVPRVRYRRW
ncbi:MAG TPA: hypothetical protein VIS71_09140, partial [Terrimicrobium sp.]